MKRLILYTKTLSTGESLNVFVDYRHPRGNGTAGYILQGSAEVRNFHRGKFIQNASPKRPDGGFVFPGKYTITAMEDNTIYRCFSALPEFQMFDFHEKQLNKDENFSAYNLIGIAAITGDITLENGKNIEEGNSLEFPTPTHVTIIAKTPSTIVLVKRRDS